MSDPNKDRRHMFSQIRERNERAQRARKQLIERLVEQQRRHRLRTERVDRGGKA